MNDTPTCCIEGCEDPTRPGQQACPKHWKQFRDVGNAVMTTVAENQAKQGIGNDEVPWNDVVAQFEIPLGSKFFLAQAEFFVVGIKGRKLIVMPVSKLMSLKKAPRGQNQAMLRQI